MLGGLNFGCPLVTQEENRLEHRFPLVNRTARTLHTVKLTRWGANDKKTTPETFDPVWGCLNEQRVESDHSSSHGNKWILLGFLWENSCSTLMEAWTNKWMGDAKMITLFPCGGHWRRIDHLLLFCVCMKRWRMIVAIGRPKWSNPLLRLAVCSTWTTAQMKMPVARWSTCRMSCVNVHTGHVGNTTQQAKKAKTWRCLTIGPLVKTAALVILWHSDLIEKQNNWHTMNTLTWTAHLAERFEALKIYCLSPCEKSLSQKKNENKNTVFFLLRSIPPLKKQTKHGGTIFSRLNWPKRNWNDTGRNEVKWKLWLSSNSFPQWTGW